MICIAHCINNFTVYLYTTYCLCNFILLVLWYKLVWIISNKKKEKKFKYISNSNHQAIKKGYKFCFIFIYRNKFLLKKKKHLFYLKINALYIMIEFFILLIFFIIIFALFFYQVLSLYPSHYRTKYIHNTYILSIYRAAASRCIFQVVYHKKISGIINNLNKKIIIIFLIILSDVIYAAFYSQSKYEPLIYWFHV